MSFREQRLEPGHPDLVRSNIDVARVFRAKGNLDLAGSFYQTATKNLRTWVGDDCFCLIPTLQEYESFLRAQNRLADARDIEGEITRLQKRRQ